MNIAQITSTNFAVTACSSYLLGSIPFGYVLMRIFRGEDVRATGSGNVGATNVARSSPALGIITLVLDSLKGLAAVAITRRVYPGNLNLAFVAAFFAVAGHMFTVWLRFRGGKGVATGLGAFVLLAPKAVLAVIAVFAVIFLLFRYVSLASIVAVAMFPLLAWTLDGYRYSPFPLGIMAAASILIIARHHSNISRLLARKESRFGRSRA